MESSKSKQDNRRTLIARVGLGEAASRVADFGLGQDAADLSHPGGHTGGQRQFFRANSAMKTYPSHYPARTILAVDWSCDRARAIDGLLRR